MDLISVSATHQGRRKYNQDTVIATLIDSSAGVVRLVAVLDGMGGMRAGDRASLLAREVFQDAIANGLAEQGPDESHLRELLTAAVARAHHAVFDEGQGDPEKQGMGTTLVAAVEKDGRFLVVNVGDSRAYLWSPEAGTLERLTRDHSLVEEAVRTGRLTQAEAEKSPYAHALTRAVGSGPVPSADVFPEPEGWFEMPAGGLLLLCSDGLTGGLDDEALKNHVIGCGDPQQLSDSLLRGAYHAGSTDNISTVILADATYKATGPAVAMPPKIEAPENGGPPTPVHLPAAEPPSAEEPAPDADPPLTKKAAPLWFKVVVVGLIAGLFLLILWRFDRIGKKPMPSESMTPPPAASLPPVNVPDAAPAPAPPPPPPTGESTPPTPEVGPTGNPPDTGK
jgi:PPM family protein phosphatase